MLACAISAWCGGLGVSCCYLRPGDLRLACKPQDVASVYWGEKG